jgi:glycolate oxidase iron-sulfur subunit
MVRRVSSEPTSRDHGTGWFDAEDAPGRRDLNTCIHCGLCLTACPTYRELKIEPDSPRGRIYLMRGLAEGRVSPTPELVQHLDNCLDCRACETVCPAGVPYGRMLEQTRGQLARRAGGGGATRWLGEWALRSLIPNRERMQLAADLMRLGQSGPIAAFMRSPLAARLLPAFARQGWAMTPPIEPRSRRSIATLAERLPVGASLARESDGTLVFKPAAPPRARVAFFTSCVMEVMFPEVTREAIRLLVLGGAQVTVPGTQGCCGALQAHAGLRRESMALARRNVRAFAFECDAVVTHSAGCGAALRDSGHLLREDTGAEAAERFGQRVRDVSEVLAQLELPPPEALPAGHSGPARRLRVAYHDPCHLAHAQKVRAAPRELLGRLPGVELLELPNSDWCCGSAGIYNLTHPEMAGAQLVRKLDSIESVSPDVVVASNPGCLLHMARGAHERGMRVPMLHLVELLGRFWPESGRSRGRPSPA